MKSLEDIDQTYEGKNKEIMKDLEKDGWAMTPFADRANYFKEQGYDVENKVGVYMIKPKSNDKLDHEVVNDFSIDAIKDNFTPPGAKEELKEEIDTNGNGEIEVDEMADFQKSLDDYASKNKKGRDDIPVATRR